MLSVLQRVSHIHQYTRPHNGVSDWRPVQFRVWNAIASRSSRLPRRQPKDLKARGRRIRYASYLLKGVAAQVDGCVCILDMLGSDSDVQVSWVRILLLK